MYTYIYYVQLGLWIALYLLMGVFLAWLQNRLIAAELEPFLSYTEKSIVLQTILHPII